MANYTRRSKYTNTTKAKQDNDNLNLDPYTLDLLCKYLITDSLYIKRVQLTNIKNMIQLSNFSNYSDKNDLEEKLRFINKGLEARLDYDIKDPNMIIRHINGDLNDASISMDLASLSEKEISWVDLMVSSYLQFQYIDGYSAEMIELCTKVLSSDFDTKSSIVSEFEEFIKKTNNYFRKTNVSKDEDPTFSLQTEPFENIIKDHHAELNSPSNILVTGMQGMNELLSGGFEAGRIYCFFGLPGEGKSSTLLNLVYQMKKYNANYKTKDPTKKPCIVYFNMENRVGETVSRLFSICTGENMKHYTPEEIIDLMRNQGQLKVTTDSPIDIIIKFKPTNSVDTGYLYTLTEDLEDEGYEVICMVQDYIGRIRSSERSANKTDPALRLEYGNIVDEMKVYASIKRIPVITVSQLNRDASKHIDEGRNKNQTDLVRLIGRSNIAESMVILYNVDGAFMIAPEVTNDGSKYLGVLKIKGRFEDSDRSFLYLPYKANNKIALTEDYGLMVPSYKTTMNDTMNLQIQNGVRTSGYHTNLNGSSLNAHPDEQNIFVETEPVNNNLIEAFVPSIPVYDPNYEEETINNYLYNNKQ